MENRGEGEVREVGGGQVMQSFVGDEEEFEFNWLRNGEPVEVLKDRGDMVSGAGAGEKSGGRVLDVLQFLEDFETVAQFSRLFMVDKVLYARASSPMADIEP